MSVPAGRYVLGVSQGFGPWQLVSATLGTADIAGRSFEVSSSANGVRLTFAEKRTVLSGSVVDKNGQPARNATVFVIDVEHSGKRADGLGVPARVSMNRTDATGRFEREVFPGTYSVLALEGSAPEDWESPESIDRLARLGKRTSVTIGQHSVIDLRLSNR